MPSPNLSRGSLLLLAVAQLSNAHTWIEQMNVIAPNGTYVGAPGYARGNVLRSTPGFSDPLMVHLIPPNGDRAVNDILPTDLICMSSQTSQTQTGGSPRLQAPAGAAIALRYQENGHVTLPQNQPGKPQNRGTNYVYGTSQSSPDDALLAIHRQWTPDGKGGDGRGALISTQNFDDGQCYEDNGGTISNQRMQQFPIPSTSLTAPKLWCQQDIALPADLAVGSTYSLYWVWDWPTMPGTPGFTDGKQEIYTTCMDIDIVASSVVESTSNAAFQFASGQDLSNAAVSGQLSDITDPTAVTSAQTIAFTASATGPASGQAASESVSPTTTDDSFLSDHTTATSGPAVEASSFTVIPIGVTPTSIPTGLAPSAAAQPTATPQVASQPSPDGSEPQGRPTGGFGGGFGVGSGIPPFFDPASFSGIPPFPFLNGSGRPSDLPGPSGFFPPSFISLSNQPTGQFGSGAPPGVQANDVPMSTLTVYDTATEFVTQTIYQTQYTKRTSESETIPAITETAPDASSPTDPSPSSVPSTTSDPETSSLTDPSPSSVSSTTSDPEASPQTDLGRSLIISTQSAPLPTCTSPSASSSTDTNTDALIVTNVAVTGPPAEQTPPAYDRRRAIPTCSQQHRAFRLRARLPFVQNSIDQAGDAADC